MLEAYDEVKIRISKVVLSKSYQTISKNVRNYHGM